MIQRTLDERIQLNKRLVNLGLYMPHAQLVTEALTFTMQIVVGRMNQMGFRLKLVQYTDGWYAAFAKVDIDDAPWQAAKEQTPELAVNYAAALAVERAAMDDGPDMRKSAA